MWTKSKQSNLLFALALLILSSFPFNVTAADPFFAAPEAQHESILGEVAEPESLVLYKKDIQHVRILSSGVDRISLFIKHKNNKIYRLSFLSEEEANFILNRVDSSEGLSVSSVSVPGRNYQEVQSWE